MTYPWLTIHTDPDERAAAIYDQKLWEMEGIQMGIEKVRAIIDEANAKAIQSKGRSGGVVDLGSGATITRMVLVPLAAAIKERQEFVLEGYKRKGARGKWWMPILSLSAEQWALITAKAMLCGIPPRFSQGLPSYPATSLAKHIGVNGKLQREFDLWKKQQRTLAAEMEHHVNLYEVMRRRVKQINSRAARKWMALSKEAEVLDWDSDTKLAIGMCMIKLAVEHSGGWFQLVRESHYKMKRYNMVQLTEKGREFILKYNDYSETTQPYMAPMICPPDPWRWTDEAENEAKSLRPQGEDPAVPAESSTV